MSDLTDEKIPFGNEGFRSFFCSPSNRINITFLQEMGFVYREYWPYGDKNKWPDLVQVMEKEINGGLASVYTCDAFTTIEYNGKNIKTGNPITKEIILKAISQL